MIFTVLKDHSSPTENRAKGRAAESTGRPPPLVWMRECWLACGGWGGGTELTRHGGGGEGDDPVVSGPLTGSVMVLLTKGSVRDRKPKFRLGLGSLV